MINSSWVDLKYEGKRSKIRIFSEELHSIFIGLNQCRIFEHFFKKTFYFLVAFNALYTFYVFVVLMWYFLFTKQYTRFLNFFFHARLHTKVSRHKEKIKSISICVLINTLLKLTFVHTKYKSTCFKFVYYKTRIVQHSHIHTMLHIYATDLCICCFCSRFAFLLGEKVVMPFESTISLYIDN